MNKKVVVLGGGTGMSCLLRGLKNFPVSITAIVSVCDDGKSTGRLRKEFQTPAVGDLRRIIISLSETEPLIEKLLDYRFQTSSDLNGHALGNLLLTALCQVSGTMEDGIESLEKVFHLKGKVLPLTEDNVILMGEMEDGSILEGEHIITKSKKNIKKVFYKEEPRIPEKVIQAIKDADMVVLSMGSVYTSVIPNLLSSSILDAIDESNAKIVSVCNLVTQPGETLGFKASDHVKVLNEYLGKRKVEVVVVNNRKISKEVAKKYATLEQKDPVILDVKQLKELNVKVVQDDLVTVIDGKLRHDSLKLGFLLFSLLMEERKKEIL